jgi:2-methylcitrate dehydratase PrpD
MSTETMPTETEDAADTVARHLARISYDDLPASVVLAAKASILDTLACMFAGSASEDVASILSLVRDTGGRPSSTVLLGDGLKVPAAQAVLVNGAMIHQFDFDDTHDLAICHPTSSCLPSALAVAEEVGDVSGKSLITSVALATDLVSRIALAIRGGLLDYPWFRAPIVGLFGTTAAAAKIRGASETQHRDALGLTLPLVSCTSASLHHGGSSVRSIRDGLVYRSGVLAAELAMRGLRGDQAVFEGKYGYYQSFFRGEYDRDKLLDGLGERFETDRISLKPWPSRRTLHRTITAVIDLMTSADLNFEKIRQVEILVGPITRPWCRPVTIGMVPQRRIDLLNNMLFAVGAAIRYRDVPLSLYNDPKRADDVVTQAVPKIRWREVEKPSRGVVVETAQVSILTTDGITHEASCDIPLGHPDRPLSSSQLRAKFLECALNSIRPPKQERLERIIAIVMSLEDLPDVACLTTLLE